MENKVKKIKSKKYRFISCGGLVAILGLLIAFFPEIRGGFIGSIYNRTGVDKPKLVIDELYLDGSTKGSFDGCPAGYYLDQQNLNGQTLIYLNPKHELHFSLRNESKITDTQVKIKNIKLNILEYNNRQIQFPFSVTQDCGAGETEKIYTFDEQTMKDALNSGTLTVIAKVADENIEKFDFVALDGNYSDFFKLKIPMPIYGIMKFNIEIDTDYKSDSFIIYSPVYFIGNNKDAQDLYQENLKR